jgi:glycosyltransferase involved in cell wall biosynthesis
MEFPKQPMENLRRFEVIIPVRNGGEALARSIQSVLSQANAQRVLLTLSDNFSTDGSPWKEVLTNYPKDQWRIISPPQPLGRVEHWTWAFAQAQLPWVKPLMVGDRTEDAFWDWVGAAIAQFPHAGMFFTESYIIDPKLAHPEAGGCPSLAGACSNLYEYRDFMRDAVRCFNRIGALSQALLRADVMRAALPFEPEFAWTADWRFCKRCLQQAPAVHNRARLVCLDRSIVRLSTSWRGIRGSFAEDWDFASRQAVILGEPRVRAFWVRSKAVGTRMVFVIGRMILPRPVRAFLTSVTGMHRKPNPTCTPP